MKPDGELSDALFGRFSSLLRSKTGIALKDYKKYLVVSRLASFVGPGKTYQDYESLYEALARGGEPELLQSFINALTTNFSYFFRDSVHFEVMAQYLRERGPREPYLRFWSAASSTGEEAYSMAMTVAQQTVPLPADRRILATDISTKVLGLARAAVYPREAILRHVGPLEAQRYFQPIEEGARFMVREPLRSSVDFRQINLHAPFPFRKPMDIIFLRNVMIYFDTAEKAALVEKVHRALKPGGLLFIGLSESLAGTKHGFRSYRDSVFMKVGG